jgi:hypothetical protein
MCKIIITLAFCGVLVACSKAPPTAAEAPKPAYPGAGTVMQDQFKVLDDAKKVEQHAIDAEAKRRAEFDQ